MNGILYRWIGRISADALFGAVLGLFLCATANASGTPAGTSTRKAQTAAEGSQSTPAPKNPSQTESKQPGTSCEGPQFQFKGWIGGRDSKMPGNGAGWPRILILKSADSSMRRFQIQVCLPQKNYSAQSGTPGWASGSSYPDTLKFSGHSENPFSTVKTGVTHGDEPCYTAYEGTNLVKPPAAFSDTDDLGEIYVPFNQDDFAALIAARGIIRIGYQTPDACNLDWDQVPIRVFEPNTVLIQAGSLYRLNDEGNWDNNIEAAVRFESRFSTLFGGIVEIRYDGISASSKNSTPTTMSSSARKADTGTDASSTVNPFSATKGVLELDASVFGYIFGRGVDNVSLAWLAGLGSTSLRSATASASSGSGSSDTGTGTFANTALRAFAGLRMIVPSLTSEGTALSKARSRVQLTLVHDNAWRFTTTAADGSSLKVDKPNRMVTEGDFDFWEAKKNDQSNVLVGAHLRWDAPASFTGGASDLRISILAAVNFFDL